MYFLGQVGGGYGLDQPDDLAFLSTSGLTPLP
jgi:hypothetical protein